MAEKKKPNSTPGSEKVIVTPSNLKSPVWKYFGFWSVDGQIVEPRVKVVCMLCKLQLAYHSTTSNMRLHLENMHPNEHGTLCGTPTKKPRLDTYFAPPATSCLSAARQEACTKKLTSFICKDMRPISVVDGTGFREFCGELEPRYRIPSRETITNRILHMYNSTSDKIKGLVQDRDVALTTDGWTSLAASYVTATAHWISEDWEMHNNVLKTKELKESPTAENLGQCIQEILDVFGIKGGSVIAITTDNATNYINAVERHLHTVNIPCVAHTINLAVRKGLGVRAIEIPVSRLRVAASHFSRSTAEDLLQQKQQPLGLKTEELINDFPTRWNSTYEMICRASEQHPAVPAVVLEKKLPTMELSTSEWSLMEKVQEVLQPFQVATEALSTDKYPTASAVLPLKHVLLAQLNKETPDEPEPPALTEMKIKIMTDLEKQYGEEKGAFMLLNKASYLDPRFHRLVHLKEEQRRQVQVAILEEIKQVNVAGGTGSEAGAEQPRDQQPDEKTALTAMGSLFGDTYCTDSPDQDISRLLQKEMSMYEQESPIPAQQNPLMWWKTLGSGRYPHIAQMARKYLSIPGSSVRSERVFSSAGNIVNEERSALAPSNVDFLVFLANNL